MEPFVVLPTDNLIANYYTIPVNLDLQQFNVPYEEESYKNKCSQCSSSANNNLIPYDMIGKFCNYSNTHSYI